jgi:putative transposase
MKKSRFSEEQIIGVVKELDAGAKPKDVSRRLGVTDQTLYRWKAKYGGLEVIDAKRLRALEDENRKLKHLIADPKRPRFRSRCGSARLLSSMATSSPASSTMKSARR